MPSGASSGFGSRREDRETALGVLYAAETQVRDCGHDRSVYRHYCHLLYDSLSYINNS